MVRKTDFVQTDREEVKVTIEKEEIEPKECSINKRSKAVERRGNQKRETIERKLTINWIEDPTERFA